MSDPIIDPLRASFDEISRRLDASASGKAREAIKRDIISLFKTVDQGISDLSALKEDGVLPEDFPEDLDAFSFELATAVYRFLARTPSRLLLVSLEDVFGEVEQANLPGTISEHPNWKRRLSVEVEQFAQDPRMIAIAAAIGGERGAGRGQTRSGTGSGTGG